MRLSMKNLTIEKTSIIIAFVLLFTIALRVPTDTDTWWHIRSGEYILNNGTIQGDPFSHTQAGGTWINHSWGSQLIMYAVWQVGGDVGLAFYTAILAVGGMALLYQISAGNAYLRIFVMILGATTAAVFWSARPQMLSFFFTTVILWLAYRYKREGMDWLWGIVPLMWLWGNIHAGWSIGYLFIFAFIVGEAFNNLFGIDENTLSWTAWRKLLLVTVISIPLLALSPYTLDNLLVPINTVNIEALRASIQEWQSPNFQQTNMWAFIAMLMGVFFAFWGSRLKFDWSGFFLLIGTLFLALLYARNIAVFAVVATPILTHHFDNALSERKMILRPRRTVPLPMAILNIILIVAAVIGVGAYALSLFTPDNIREMQAEILPINAVNYLNENDLPREMFNSYNWGGYLMFAATDYPVFVDGRTDLYGEFVEDYIAIYRNRVESIEAELENYGVNLVVVEQGVSINAALSEISAWQITYEDDLAVIWVRDEN